MSIVGARPQFVKLAPIQWESTNKFIHQILHTGQHYDPLLSSSFFRILEIPNPDFNLQIGSGTHGAQTGKMLIEIEDILLREKPDHVIIYGDTNTTLAGALAASKLHIPISHIEAGLRSFNFQMPEEINRITADHVSNLLFAPTLQSMKNLVREGLDSKALLVGDVMLESLRFITSKIDNKSNHSDFLFATIHRAENTDDEERIRFIVSQLRKSPVEVHLHCHPRLEKVLLNLGILMDYPKVKFFPPLDYFSTIQKISNSCGVITDSGGLQKEAYILNKSCLVVRKETEWVETLQSGRNFLDPELGKIEKEWWFEYNELPEGEVFGDGNSARKIVSKILG